MAIDTANEALIPLPSVPEAIPKVGGRSVSVETVRRWARQGCRGIRLETVWVGGQCCTSREALARFHETIARASEGGLPPVTRPPGNPLKRSPAQAVTA